MNNRFTKVTCLKPDYTGAVNNRFTKATCLKADYTGAVNNRFTKVTCLTAGYWRCPHEKQTPLFRSWTFISWKLVTFKATIKTRRYAIIYEYVLIKTFFMILSIQTCVAIFFLKICLIIWLVASHRSRGFYKVRLCRWNCDWNHYTDFLAEPENKNWPKIGFSGESTAVKMISFFLNLKGIPNKSRFKMIL